MYPIVTCLPMPTPYPYPSPYPVLRPQPGGYNVSYQYAPTGAVASNTSDETRALRKQIASLQRQVTSLENKVISQKKEIVGLEDCVSDLAMSLEAYKLLRNRFISTFKRDKLGNATWDDLNMISEGNGWAHGGDAMVDAQLYKGVGRRSDDCDFELLYGLPPSVVADLTHYETINVLNCHAAVIASDRRKGSPLFYQKFTTFIDLFKKSGYDERYLKGKRTAVTDAYMAFHKCYKDEVTCGGASTPVAGRSGPHAYS